MKKTPRFKAIIACGPVIIEKINGKKCVLLDKHGEKIWKFPGSSIHKKENAEQCAIKRVKEELGINVKLIKPLKPIIIWRKGEAVVLIHFLAKRHGKIKPAKHIKQWAWIPINKLPKDCAKNIKIVLREMKD